MPDLAGFLCYQSHLYYKILLLITLCESSYLRIWDTTHELSITDLGDLTEEEDAGLVVDTVESVVALLKADGKIPIMLGGEHSITTGAVRNFKECSMVIIDAHSDFRRSYFGWSKPGTSPERGGTIKWDSKYHILCILVRGNCVGKPGWLEVMAQF